MKWFAGSLLALSVTSIAVPAFAFPHIDTISSETLSTSPLRVKTTFTVQLVGYEPFGYDAFTVSTGAGPTVTLFDCQAPAPWNCSIASYSPTGVAYFVPPIPYPWPWPGVLTFAITSDQASPCVEIDFQNALLSKTPQTHYDYIVNGCLVVDAPTPASPSSWGRVKAIYR